ncbi:MAG TPA: hypothetical protein VG826_09025 [Pirellulales bacterium]|nr:hypothetical protein [Pirellulales bacterium]
MFPFFRYRTRIQKPSRRKPNRLVSRRFRLEGLESRNCPSSIGLSLEAQTVAYPNVQVNGAVFGSGQGYQVTLSGPVSASVSVNQSGQFSYFGPATGLGTVTATVTDSAGDSGQASTNLMHSPPQITGFSVMPTGQGKQVDLAGHVSADTPAGLVVTFSGTAGLQTTSTMTDAYGNFNMVTTAASLGSVTAVVTDDWGAQSMPVTTQIMDNGPQMPSFTVVATGQGKQVDVSGNVGGMSSSGITVTFSGSAGVSGSATTDSNGHFDLVTSASRLGTVSAVATDVWGVSSGTGTATLSVPRPYVSPLTVTSLGSGEWQIQGSVSGPDVADDTVQLSGVASGSATPNSSGSFSIVVQMVGNPNGTEYAVATDIWGQTSNQATYTFSS